MPPRDLYEFAVINYVVLSRRFAAECERFRELPFPQRVRRKSPFPLPLLPARVNPPQT